MKLNRDNFLVQVKYGDLLSDAGGINKYFLGFGGELYLEAEEIANYQTYIINRIKTLTTPKRLSLRIHAPIIEVDYSKIQSALRYAQPVYESLLGLCKTLGIKSIVTHADFDYRCAFPLEEQLKNAVILWSRLSGMLGKENIRLNIENHFEPEPDYLLRLMDAVKSSNFAMCVDAGHLNAFGTLSMRDWLKKYPAGSIREIHLADNLGDGDTHLPMGKGNIDFENFFKILSERNENYVFILEPRNIEEAKESLIFLEKKGYLVK